MSIIIVCQNCRQRFKVSEKFAGKQGPCPKCKTVLRVPTKDEEVKIHTPEHSEEGARGKSGELVLKPISREETRVSWWVVGAVGAIVLVAVILARVFRGHESVTTIFAIGGTVLAPPLVLAGYWFLRSDGLEPYHGMWLSVRLSMCFVGRRTVTSYCLGAGPTNFGNGRFWGRRLALLAPRRHSPVSIWIFSMVFFTLRSMSVLLRRWEC